jgi:hypothetical protein
MRPRLAAFVATAALTIAGADALELQITEADLIRAIALARGDSKALDAFHRPYVIAVPNSDVQEIEVVTELRRAVLSAADRNRVNEPQTAAVRRLQQVLDPHRGRVSIVAHFRFSPQTALVTFPQYDIAIVAGGGGNPRVNPESVPIELQRTPLYTAGRGSTFLAGGDVEAVFDGVQVGQRQRRILVTLQGKVLANVPVDFASIR